MNTEKARIRNMRRRLAGGLILLLVFVLMVFSGCGKKDSSTNENTDTTHTASQTTTQEATQAVTRNTSVQEDGSYDSKDEVAAYIVAFGRLPDNYITKKEARSLGWSGGSVEKYAPGMCIGGDRFGNYEGNLPKGKYTECDIDTLGKDSRGAKRLVFSVDEIYYTDNHYKSFEKVCDR